MPRSLPAIVALGISAAFAILSASPGVAQHVDPKLWVTNGPVHSIVSDAGTIYIGGEFTRVGPATGGGVPIDAASGGLPASFPRVAGDVKAVVPDGSGGWYIGGSFTAVGSVPRFNLAHLGSDLSVTAWNPDANDWVLALSVSGSTVYAGGWFTSIGGQARRYIAALDATTGAATAWNPHAAGTCNLGCSPGTVWALVVAGNVVYAGGSFDTIGGQPRRRVAALDAATGTATDWQAGRLSGDVHALAVSDSTIYLTGPRILGALDVTTGAFTDWHPNPIGYGGTITALAVSGTTVYAGGSFSSIGGQLRNFIAALDATTGSATAWDPNANGAVEALAVSGSTIYAGGSFTSIGGEPRTYVVALDATTGAATAWDPEAGGGVEVLAASGPTVYAGGDFTTVGGEPRNNIAALDAATGTVTAWDPDADGGVNVLAVLGSNVYAGGGFTSIGGQPRNYLAALDATTGAATAWNPNPGVDPFTPPVLDVLAGSGSTVYVGGLFTSIGGQSRNNIAALDAVTGAATAWDPNADSEVNVLAVSGSTVYAGGLFATIGGQTRNHIAAVDATTGAATTWDPDANGPIDALALSGSAVYAGGSFTSIGGQPRNSIAALDATTGAATTWDPDANGGVTLLAASGSAVYAGGGFTSIDGQPRNHIAAVDATSGLAIAWDPNPGGGMDCSEFGCTFSVLALAVDGSTVYAGGDFTTIGVLPQAGIAGIGGVTTPTLLSLVSAEAEPGRVRLTWFAADGRILGATVYRRTETEAWTVIARISADGTGRLFFEDTHVIAGERYGYRLGILVDGAEEFLGGEAWVDVPRALEFTLAGPRPNPASRGFTVAFSLPDAEPARLELLDLAGRRLIVRDVGSLGQGSHVLALTEGRTIAPGLYVIRLSRSGGSLTARAIVLR
jgi:hypothetical protein